MAHDPHANRRVAANLRRARELRHLSQEDAAERISSYTAKPWDRQAIYRAEASATAETRRVRRFDADELVAFSQAFSLPLAYFFLPADDGGQDVADVVAQLVPLWTSNPQTIWLQFMRRLVAIINAYPEAWDALQKAQLDQVTANEPWAPALTAQPVTHEIIDPQEADQ